MNGKIFLSGGGTRRESFLLDKEFAKLLKRRLLYIPIARKSSHQYKECLKWIKGVFRQFNFNKIEMWIDLKNKTIADLKEFDGVYLGGGNTFKLLNEIKKTKFDNLLLNFYKSGGHIYGGSAGAIILGKDIRTAKQDKNEVKLKDFRGLNLINGYSIWCHYTPKDDFYIKKIIKKWNIKIIALPEGGGIIVENKKFTPCGFEKCFIFEKNMKKEL